VVRAGLDTTGVGARWQGRQEGGPTGPWKPARRLLDRTEFPAVHGSARIDIQMGLVP
jgi:hypothetical protein